MRKTRILYIMGIDWDWIYQRPQILAERLSKDFDVTVVYPRSILKGKKKKSIENINEKILVTLPLQEKNKLIFFFSQLINKHTFSNLEVFDIIYIGYPLYYRYIRKFSGKVIYDCMDEFDKLYPDKKNSYKIIQAEEEVVNQADLLVATSLKLKMKINNLNKNKECILIRNGVEVEKIFPIKKIEKKLQYKIGYIGTLAEWFDYEILQKSLESCEKIEYHLFGPIVYKPQKKMNKIFFEGSKPHNELWNAICDFDCLVMPFLLNEIVLAVDPVKLYEYIAFGKCIISVYYDEIARFNKYVYFYKSKEEYFELLNFLVVEGFPPKYTEEEQREFIYNNTWDIRYSVLKNKIR